MQRRFNIDLLRSNGKHQPLTTTCVQIRRKACHNVHPCESVEHKRRHAHARANVALEEPRAVQASRVRSSYGETCFASSTGSGPASMANVAQQTETQARTRSIPCIRACMHLQPCTCGVYEVASLANMCERVETCTRRCKLTCKATRIRIQKAPRKHTEMLACMRTKCHRPRGHT